MKTWYKIQAKSNDETSIDIHAEIGAWGISSSDFLRDLRGLGEVKQIRISIDSPGGSVFDAYSIANALMKHPATVTAEVAGMAASAASYIACAADKLIMPENSWLMIHQPWTVAIGDSDDMRETADFLDRQGDKIMKLCAAKAGMNQEQLEAMIANAPGKELWLDGLQAEEMGFADEVINRIEVFAKFDTSRFVMTPQSLQANSETPQEVAPVEETPTPAPVEETPVEAVEEAPVTEPQAKSLLSRLTALFGGETDETLKAALSVKDGELIAAKAKIDALESKVAYLEPLAKGFDALAVEVEKLEKEKQTAEAKAAAQVASLGFTPETERDLPDAENDNGDILAQFEAITDPAERTKFYKQNQAAIRAANFKTQS